ncbi:MAG: Gfo/Idh/MocA family protein [Geminicoccales bacterium]
MAKRKIAIIGLGKISLDQHLPVIEASDQFELAAVVSQRGLSHHGLPSFKTPMDLYKALPEIEVVTINTPPRIRHALAREALDAGKDVLLEKPPAATLSEFADLKTQAEKLDRVLFATWHSQYNPAVDATKALLADIGVDKLSIHWREDVRKWHPGQDWVWQPGGFGVFDPGINALSILVRILPFSPFVHQAELTYPANQQTPIAASIIFSSADPSNPALTAEFDWREQGQEIWQILIDLKDGRKAKLVQGGATLWIDETTVVDAPKEEYRRIYDHFANLLNERQSDADGTPLTLIADAMLIGERHTTTSFNW